MEKLDAYHSYGFKSQFPNILQCYDQQTLIVWSPCSLNWIKYSPQSQWYLLPFLWLIIQRVKHGRTMKGLCGFLTALYKMRAPQLSVTTLTRRKQAKLLKKKKQKPAVLRRACPQYGGGGSFTITISTIRHTEYSFIFFLLLYILFCFVKRQPGSMLIWKWAGYVVIWFICGKKRIFHTEGEIILKKLNPLKMSLLSMPFVSSSEHLCPHSTWRCSIVANWHHLKTESSCAQTSIV